MSASLDGVHAKINRAEFHVEQLKLALNEWVAACTTPTLLRTETQPDGKQVYFTLTTTNPPPSCSLHLGDAIHNFRSALDHLICQLAIAAGNPSACDKTQFPIFIQGTAEERQRVKRMIRHVSTTAQAIIERLQPYERWPHNATAAPVWVLAELDNIDKHRLLIVANQKIADGEIELQIGDSVRSLTLSKVSAFKPLELGAIPFRITLTGPEADKEVKVNARATIGVVFSQTGLKCDGGEVLPWLRTIATDVKGIVGEFDGKGFF